MNQNDISNYHVQYIDVSSQHWHPSSESFAGGDNLMTALNNGWSFDKTVVVEQHWFAGMRSTHVYYFELTRDDEKMTMPVLECPYVARLLSQADIRVVEKGQGQKA